MPTTESNIQNYYDYDRRPPKSSELFDPNAPGTLNALEKKHRPYSGGILDEMRHLQNIPRSPSHDSFFQLNQLTQVYNNHGPTKQKESPQPQVDVLPKSIKDDTLGTEAIRLEHILEICDLSSESTDLFVEIEQSGAVIKRLDSGIAIAIYKTAIAAKEALSREYSGFCLRRWKAPVVTSIVPPTAQIANLSIQQ